MSPQSIADALYADASGNNVYESLWQRAAVTAPGAGGSICTLAAPPAGLYQITFVTGISVVNDVSDNMRVFYQGAGDLPLPVGGIAGGDRMYTTVYKRLNGAQNVEVRASAAAAATCVYMAAIIATKVAE